MSVAPKKSAEPIPSPQSDSLWGSDIIADAICALDVPYLALNPGASFRGIHDSLVNHLGNSHPKILLAIHEEGAVAIAHGYAKVAGRPMVAMLHANVGLMHGSMGIFNAWCDRVPMLVVGATGPFDAEKRRPWIDWIHTSQDQGALVRPFVKWDDQPAGLEATCWALAEGNMRAQTAPRGPVYINIDADIQEAHVETPPPPLDMARYAPPLAAQPDPALITQAAELLRRGGKIVILAGRSSRDEAAWDRRIALAEHFDAQVVADFKTGSSFPSRHPLMAGPAGYFVSPECNAAIGEADTILALDWIDLGGTLRAAFGSDEIKAKVIHASLDSHSHHGWSKDAGLPAPVDIRILNEPDDVVAALVDELGAKEASVTLPAPSAAAVADAHAQLTAQSLARGLRTAFSDRAVTLLRMPLSWTGADWDADHPLSILGYDGGGGVGSGTGMAVGGALALRDAGSDRFPLAVIGDGDFLMNASTIWTAINAGIPLMLVIANNRSFFNDEVHQEKVAIHRGRPIENKAIGLEMCDPDIAVADLATSFGATGMGPVNTPTELLEAAGEGRQIVEGGGVVVIDARIEKGYSPAMASAMRGS